MKQAKILSPDHTKDLFYLAGRTFSSRLLVGTGKYRDPNIMKAAIEASGAEIITVAVRRMDLSDTKQKAITDYLPQKKFTYLPNTAGCYSAEDALRTLRLAREAGGGNLVKLEVIGSKSTLYPDVEETLRAAKILVEEGFDVMAYTSDDPVAAKKLEECGCVAIMPLASPIGSGLGIQNPLNIEFIVKQSSVPVLIDAGVGTASDAAIAMELGCDGVLLNTAIAMADNPIKMAEAMRLAVMAGRTAFLAGRMAKKLCANASSPQEGLI